MTHYPGKSWLILALGFPLLLYAAHRLGDSHQLFINAHILTMDEALPEAQALVIEHGRIAFVGSTEAVQAQARWYSRTIDFEGRTLMPGFVDAHSHFLTVGLQAITIDLNPPPAGSVGSLKELYARLQSHIDKTPPGEWILGFNYDNTAFPSGAHPDKRELDKLSSTHRIFLRHSSGHMGVGNSPALDELLPRLASANPYIGTYAGSNELNGLLQESAAPSLSRFVNEFSFGDYLRVLLYANKSYVSQGFTTVQSGTADSVLIHTLRWLSRLGILPLRLIVWASHDKLGNALQQGSVLPGQWDTDSFSLSTVKLIADGSPQGYTAYLGKAYHVPPLHHHVFRGHPAYGRDELRMLIGRYLEQGWAVAVHTNGDAAIEDVLDALTELNAATGSDAADSVISAMNSRPVPRPGVILVHAQTIRQDQLQRLKGLGVSPSYFPAHTYYWGDWHINKTLGPDRAAAISPLRSTESLGVRYSIHTDAPVTSVLSMQLLWSATERRTASGLELGPAERVTRESALRAMTQHAAWQGGIDATVGSLAVNKFADIIELSDNPLVVDEVRSIKVLRTFIGGAEVFNCDSCSTE